MELFAMLFVAFLIGYAAGWVKGYGNSRDEWRKKLFPNDGHKYEITAIQVRRVD
jgi:hypothetical protein